MVERQSNQLGAIKYIDRARHDHSRISGALVFLGHPREGSTPFVPLLLQAIVALNVDTLYASSSIDASKEPVVLYVPSSQDVGYSVLVMDAFGYNYQVGIPDHPAGETFSEKLYVLVGPSLSGNISLPVANATLITLPYDYMVVIFRSDVSSENGTDLTQESNEFRSKLQLSNLTSYESNPEARKTKIIPVEYYSEPYKVVHDRMAQEDPITYLKMLQKAVGSVIVPPLSGPEIVIKDQFDAIFGNEKTSRCYSEFAAGTKSAYQDIVKNYLGNENGNGWIHFVDITQWNASSKEGRLNRASTTEYIQWANGIDTAAYYHTFVDASGNMLDGSGGQQYTITFTKDALPEALRFWSITAYTPDSVELIPNDANKYHVASYTPDLEYAQDGSLTVYISAEQPTGVSDANWLPVSDGPFNLMLRIYGVVPNSTVASNTYEPPPVVP
jgi:hypothetical protein